MGCCFYQYQAASDNEALISDTESVGDSEESKINEQVQAINLNTSAATSNTGEFTEEEDEKAEAFKAAGNEAFKGKYQSSRFDLCRARPIIYLSKHILNLWFIYSQEIPRSCRAVHRGHFLQDPQ